jgi:hypothetical protein
VLVIQFRVQGPVSGIKGEVGANDWVKNHHLVLVIQFRS